MNIAIAFGAGILSFLSPCVLPLVPAFLVNLAGEAALAGTQRARTLVHALAFVLGFSVVFTLLWVAIALVGAFAGDLVFWLQRLGGLLLIVLGMHMLGLITIPLFARELDLRLEGDTTGLPRSFLIGAAFGIGMTPCVGPYLALILDLLLNQDLVSGAALLLAYALGLGVPFLVIAAGIGGQRITAALRRSIRVVNAVGGVLVIAMGLLLVSGQFARLPQLFNFLPLLG
jgi:cytochrome c-type biogenesis protein